ncbi:MAG TPA: tRNA (adenosine(37)-N6)-threonylcarbamoyltransferase complex ATPase subunit type 1 TsaE [Candidatus Methylacidiphilales bacterium]|jgi:tRNA threonylcarbamoyladenosine biosynthesis protein TsaE|nr:tRNA (adenosine(37)-N6)-threonylcarbamoyltransferase complex ATPase subunit type 1 TsaE [Candidatus Methylacidiphilales bacterium]
MGLTILNSVEAAQAFGEKLAADFTGGEIIALHGVLGAGKTQLAKGLARGLGFYGDVTSPTFTIVHEYCGGRLPMYHIDLYRIQSEKEAVDIGLEEYLPGDGVTVIEWPERIVSLLPPQTQHWGLEVVSLTERVIRLMEEPVHF